MSLLARIAAVGGVLLLVAISVAIFVWQPASRAAFVERTGGLLESTQESYTRVTTSLVEETMNFAADTTMAADRQRALSIKDLPLDLYENEDKLREAMVKAVADPEASTAIKLGAVRGELMERTRGEVEKSVDGLRAEQQKAAERHGSEVGFRTVAAWSGLLLLLIGAFGLVLDRIALKPLHDATKAVERFGAGERGVRLDPSGAREIATLARVFNETAGANEQLRDSLEEKVRERTAALVRAARASTAGTMAGGVAHEFNNLLGGILGCADEALDEDLSDDARALLAMIRKTAQRGVGMTQTMLGATRADPHFEMVEPDALIDEALAEVRPPDGIEVRHVRDPAIQVPADATMLRQVLANLIRNAVTARGEDGRLELAVAREGEQVTILVGDDGPGIDSSIRDVLFEPFVTTRRGGREGAGLGLFLVERLVSAHDGTVEVESGDGTRFTVRLPSARDS
ncbi:MAG: HAMP domain-containing sensor histidine kinase [Planctomycetota bacterium]